MQKLLIILITFFCINDAMAQSCLPQGISFSTQAQIDSFHIYYPVCTQIEGDVTISGSDINNLNGLIDLTSIAGSLTIKGENLLTSLTGLNSLQIIGGDLVIGQFAWGSNRVLTSLTGLENLTTIGGGLGILCDTILTSLAGLNNVATIGGALFIGSDPVLTNLTGLENITSVGYFFYIEYNQSLLTLEGLDKLKTIEGDFYIGHNTVLNCLCGIDSLTSIGGSFWIDHDSALTSLTGLEKLTSIGTSATIYENPILSSLTALNNLTHIGTWLDIYNNDALTSLTGLDNINPASIYELYIMYNDSLSDCAVESICVYLDDYNWETIIQNNLVGCNNQHEVRMACQVSMESLPEESPFLVYPNPTSIQITIETTTKGQLSISNLNCQELLQQEITEPKTIIDVSTLHSGIYFIKLVNNKTVEIGKLIKE